MEGAPQLPPRVRGPRSASGWIGLTLGVLIAAAIALPLGLALLVVGVAAGIVAVAFRIIGWLIGWIWYGIRRGRRPYPFVLHPPSSRRARRVVLNDLFLTGFPRFVGTVARVAVFVFVPLALAASAIGMVSRDWRARPYIAVFSLPALERKFVALGNRRGYFRDGHGAEVVPYDEFLADRFPQYANFGAWWRDPDAREQFVPEQRDWQHPSHFSGLALGPYPDVLGLPGLAASAFRRTEIRGLRDVMISQREIDDMGDPDLDDRPECGVVRVVSRTGADGTRYWIVQSPSTRTWHPRAGAAPNDITADFVALGERETTLTRGVLEVIARVGIRPEDRLLLAGFSLGGMVAAQLAERCRAHGLPVTHMITAAAATGRERIDPRIRILSLEHLLDTVPRLEGRENPVWAGRAPGAPEWVTIKAGPPVPLGYRLSATHHSPSYAESAGVIEDSPPDARYTRFWQGTGAHDGAREFFGPDQRLSDYAVTRRGISTVRPAVPFYLHGTVPDGITRTTLRTTLRRVPGVIAVDIYPSRSGYPTTIVWNADVLVRSLLPWFERVERASVYTGLLSLLKRRSAVGIRLRLQAKESPGVIWEATVQRVEDGRWRETVDVSFSSAESQDEFLPLLLPDGWASRITYYPADAFAPSTAPGASDRGTGR